MKETTNGNKGTNDEEAVRHLIEALRIPITHKAVIRIGNLEKLKRKPVRVILHCKKDKERVIKNLVNLKNKPEYKRRKCH